MLVLSIIEGRKIRLSRHQLPDGYYPHFEQMPYSIRPGDFQAGSDRLPCAGWMQA